MAQQKFFGITVESSDLKWWRDLFLDLDVMLVFMLGVGWSIKGMVRAGQIADIVALLAFAVAIVFLKRLIKWALRQHYRGRNMSNQVKGLLIIAIVLSIVALFIF